MEVRPRKAPPAAQRAGRGSGSGLCKRRRDALGPRKRIIRLPEGLAHQLKVVAAHERITAQDLCAQLIIPGIRKAMQKHGL